MLSRVGQGFPNGAKRLGVQRPSGALGASSRCNEMKAEARGKRETVGKVECGLREFLESKARNFGDDVINARLEARRGGVMAGRNQAGTNLAAAANS